MLASPDCHEPTIEHAMAEAPSSAETNAERAATVAHFFTKNNRNFSSTICMNVSPRA